MRCLLYATHNPFVLIRTLKLIDAFGYGQREEKGVRSQFRGDTDICKKGKTRGKMHFLRIGKLTGVFFEGLGKKTTTLERIRLVASKPFFEALVVICREVLKQLIWPEVIKHGATTLSHIKWVQTSSSSREFPDAVTFSGPKDAHIFRGCGHWLYFVILFFPFF